MIKLIGGECHGMYWHEKLPSICVKKEEFSEHTMPFSTKEYVTYTEHYYTLRQISVPEDTIFYYAPENWTDFKALRYILT